MLDRPLARRVATAVLALTLVASAVGAAYLATHLPRTDEPTTELYLLGSNGTASDYPTDLAVGEAGTVVVAVDNHLRQSRTYTVVATFGGETALRRTVTLAPGESWRRAVTFRVREPGEHALEVRLYRGRAPDGSSAPYRRVVLRVTARAGTGTGPGGTTEQPKLGVTFEKRSITKPASSQSYAYAT